MMNTMSIVNVFDQGDKEETRTVTTASGTPSSDFSVESNRLPLDLESVSLVGRSTETKQLVEAFERIRKEDAPAKIILIRGESGTGKSVLVENLERSEKKGREFFISGKFQQYGQTRLYGAFIDATTELSFAIDESESLNDIRQVVLDTLSSEEIQLLTSVMPTIEFIIPREKDQDLDTSTNEQSFNRFMEVYRKFLQCVCRQEHPVVLFLDDLQWVDDVSRQLFDSIAKDTKMRNLLVIVAVRQDPAVTGVFDLSEEARLDSSEIVLGALTEEDVNRIISNATARPVDETRDLAAVVHRKTGGNAYFVIQYLEMLHREELLVFSFKKSRWSWKTEKISSVTDVSDNVVQVLIRKIESLEVGTQVALIVAACLGYSFRVDVVACILGSQDFLHSIPGFVKDKNLKLPMTKTDTQIALTKAVQTGLIDKLSSTKCKFSHDRVQQSAYSMLPDGKERRYLQTALGRILLEMSRQAGSEDWMLFAAVDLLSNGNVSTPESSISASADDGLALEMDEVDELFPQLCLEAAQKAAKKSAFRSAARYADEGISRLRSRGSQEDNYDLWLELSNLSAEMHYCRGAFEASNKVVDSILEGSRSVDDCFRAYNVSMSTYTSMEDWGAAISFGSRILSDLGVPTPKSPSMLNVVALLYKSKRLMKGRTPSDLERLPVMENPRKAQALFILGCSAFCSAGKGEETRCVVLCLKMFLLTLEYGICGDSPYAFAAYGMCMAHIGEYALGYEYGKLAIKMLERPGMEKSIAKVSVVVYSYLYFLKSPIQESLEPLLSGYTAGMRAGDVCQAAFCLRQRACMGVFSGVHLVENEREMLSFCEFYRGFKQHSSMKLQAPWLQLTLNLLGRADDVLQLSGSAMDEDSLFSELTSSASSKERNPDAAFVLLNTHYAKRTLLYTFGEFEMAEKDRQRSERYNNESPILCAKLYDYWFCSLICLAMARKGKRVRYYRRQAKAYKKELTVRAEQGCVNCVPLLSLVSAEEQALKDRSGDLILYKEAISMLGRCGFRLFKAIACERAAEYLLECGCSDRANEYLHQAWDEFYDYGAFSKHNQMREKYEGIIEFSGRLSAQSRSSSRLKAHSLKKWQQDV